MSKQGSRVISIELRLTEADREKLWDYCTKLDITIGRFVHKLVMKELASSDLLSLELTKPTHVKEKE